MRKISLERLADALIELPENPRVVVSGNAATPWILLEAFDNQVSHYRLHMLNTQAGAGKFANCELRPSRRP